MCLYKNMHMNMYMYMCICVSVRKCVYVYVYVYAYMYVCVYVFVFVYVYAYVCVCVCVCVFVSTYVCVYDYLHVYSMSTNIDLHIHTHFRRLGLYTLDLGLSCFGLWSWAQSRLASCKSPASTRLDSNFTHATAWDALGSYPILTSESAEVGISPVQPTPNKGLWHVSKAATVIRESSYSEATGE